MHFAVPLQIDRPEEALVTDHTFVLESTFVGCHMVIPGGPVTESFPADLTREGLLTCVYHQMFPEPIYGGQGLSTMVAQVPTGVFGRVQLPHMKNQAGVVEESFITCHAGEGEGSV